MLRYDTLQELYVHQRLSSAEVAEQLGCSIHKVDYWLGKHRIQKRSISEAVYIKNNPSGDPFHLTAIDTLEKAELYGMGLGLYWGEGTKVNQHSVRLGNSDPELIKMFMRFLVVLFDVNKNDLRFGLQVFSDISSDECLSYWVRILAVKHSQFYKVHITPSGSIGTYRKRASMVLSRFTTTTNACVI